MQLMNKMDELYLDNIDEYVNDHDKIVTYKWLSGTLGVHVNTAKQMLYHYLDNKRKESSAQLHATYLVSGKCVDNGQTSHRVSLVREEQLEDFKSKMSLIVSIHVYSVQKALLRDSGPLYAVDYDAVKDNLLNCSKYSAIRCSGAVPMSSSERDLQRAPPPPVPEPQQSKKPSASDKTASKAKPAKGIMGMFTGKTASAKSKDISNEIKSEEAAVEVDIPKGKASAKSNHMMNFFGNQNTKKQEKPVKKEEEVAPEPSSAELQQPEKKQERVMVEPSKNKKDSRSKIKRLQSSDSEEEKMEKKKRRRIKKPVSDSSEDEDVIPDSPPPTVVREVSPVPAKEPASQPSYSETSKIRKRRRVLKSRTFVDEEGCIVTEKGYESESYSEEESAAPATKQATKNQARAKTSTSNEKKSVKKTTENKATKQASIMGFFQKK
nr:DNA polymerase delta subunit 3-like [Nerophis lumbriciformis]